MPGHWEGDLLTGANDTHIATLVERNTRFTMLIKIPRKDTTTVVAALAKHISKLPEELRRSLTWDQGKEMHAHKRFTVATNVQVYFCDPRSPWQRGSNENTNGLLRQYLPRGTDFSRISQSYLNAIAPLPRDSTPIQLDRGWRAIVRDEGARPRFLRKGGGGSWDFCVIYVRAMSTPQGS